MTKRNNMIEKIGIIMVFAMALLQAAYAAYAYIDPQAFAALRGTELFTAADSDWVKIYASRTLFVALIIWLLLANRAYTILVWASLLGTVMPITDAWLAYQAGAENIVIYKHLATIVYLLLLSVLLEFVVKNTKQNNTN